MHIFQVNCFFNTLFIPFSALVLAFVTGCTYVPDTAAPESNLSADEGIDVAYQIESQGEGRVAGWGRGESMQPVFSDNTVLVIHPIAWEDLEKGMLVAYYGPAGDRVVHSLIRKRESRDYWMAKGINNMQADGGRVTKDNLIGVVYASIQTANPEE
ncbi:S24/S26 family peptidase [Rubellicoccus peritrichatus]|uniref:S24/S26 family peptidase n=1 Tax=Rubellicoccus peritrichatus TaxID=3080537 RepID=A0AAQ3LD62_9BACT|nr:S24/S26 family peptidase [Puniceicoccus sp. CR14]WOO39844.1 S24/S26 family peptidase [Puniceicoccus sp. CR14]